MVLNLSLIVLSPLKIDLTWNRIELNSIFQRTLTISFPIPFVSGEANKYVTLAPPALGPIIVKLIFKIQDDCKRCFHSF